MNDWVFIHPWAHFAAHFWILGNVTRFRLLFCCRECYAIAFVFGMTFTSLPRLTRPCWDAEFWLEPFSVQILMMGTCQCLAQTEFPIFAFFFKVASIGLIKGFLIQICHPFCCIAWWAEVYLFELDCLEHDEKLAYVFAVSTLAPCWELPQCRTLYIPPWSCLNPKEQDRCWAANDLVRWAESGGWCCERSLKRPSFGCLSSRQKAFSTLTDTNCF